MRTNALILATALAVLVVVDLGLRASDDIPEPDLWASPYTQARAEALIALGDTDLVVLGSSIGGASISAGSLSDGVGYNASLPGMAPRVWEQWYDDVVDDTTPSVVLIATDMRFFDGADPNSARLLDQYLNSPGRLRHVQGPTLDDRVGDAWELYRLRPRLREPERLASALTGFGDIGDWRPVRIAPDGRHVGFTTAEYDPSEEWLERLTASYRNAEWGGVEGEALRRIVADAQADGATVVMVITPAMWSELVAAFPGGWSDVEAYEATIRDIGADFGVPVLEFPQFDDDPSLYADYYHMNGEGSRRFTAAIAEALEELGL